MLVWRIGTVSSVCKGVGTVLVGRPDNNCVYCKPRHNVTQGEHTASWLVYGLNRYLVAQNNVILQRVDSSHRLLSSPPLHPAHLPRPAMQQQSESCYLLLLMLKQAISITVSYGAAAAAGDQALQPSIRRIDIFRLK